MPVRKHAAVLTSDYDCFPAPEIIITERILSEDKLSESTGQVYKVVQKVEVFFEFLKILFFFAGNNAGGKICTDCNHGKKC